MTKFEDVIAKTGDLGVYQKRLVVVLVLMALPVAFNTYLPVVTLTVPDHRCSLDNYPNDTFAVQNSRHRALINASIPWADEAHDQRSKCTKWRPSLVILARDDDDTVSLPGNTSDVEEVACDRYVYDKMFFDRTMIEELDIVCDREEWRTHANMAMMLGKLVSALIQGITSDLFGRRKSLLSFIGVMVGALFANAFIFNVPSLLAFRFIAGLATTSTYMNCFVLAVEFLGTRYRQAFNVLLGIVWSCGGFLLTGVAYGLRDFEFLCLALGAPTVLCFAAFWLVPESPRWLVSKGRVSEARKVIEQVAKVNKKPFPEEEFLAMVKEEEEELRKREKEREEMKEKRRDNVVSLFSHPILAFRFSILLVNWMTNSMTYYGILFNVQNLSGDIYLNFFLTNCVDVVGNVASYFVVDRYGRKCSYLGFLGLATLACLASIFPPLYASESDAGTILIILSLAGRLGISTSFNVLYLFSAEIYPTSIRNTAMGVSSMASRVGSISAPYVADLGKRVGGDMQSALPLIIFGVAALISWLGALLLPETNKHKLPDTILEAANFARKPSRSEASTSCPDDDALKLQMVFHISDEGHSETTEVKVKGQDNGAI